MRFTPTDIAGPVLVDLELREDSRGFFARTYCRQEFEDAGLEPLSEQANVSWNAVAGTVRGMHYQVAPATEAKLVRCTAGGIVDTVVDVRPGSPTYLRSVSVELTATNRRALYVPPMFAHGYQTLEDASEVVYQVSAAYTPGTERGLRHDDPALGLRWPLPVTAISDKDAGWELVSGAAP